MKSLYVFPAHLDMRIFSNRSDSKVQFRTHSYLFILPNKMGKITHMYMNDTYVRLSLWKVNF